MSLMTAVLALVGGFVVLVFAGDYLVRGATTLARRAGVPALIVGLTIVACGTSAPELFVSIRAALSGAPELALANVIGSNIANVLLVLGVPALIMAYRSDAPSVGRNAFVALLASVALALFSLDGQVTRPEGGLLLVGLAAFLVWQFIRARSPQADKDPILDELVHVDEMEGLPESWTKISAFIILGALGLPLGAHFVVEGAVSIAAQLNVPPEFVGLTAIAFGTSLPELATSVIAALRRHADVAIGNVIGSNVFNVLGVAGAAGLTANLPATPTMIAFDLRVMLIVAVVLWLLTVLKVSIGRLVGIALLGSYLGYIAMLGRVEGMW